MFTKLLLAAVALQAVLVSADPTPSVPGPGDTYKEGGDCVIEWGTDTTGKWTDMQIELKTGNNLAMVPLTVITTIDATTETRYVYPCPDVSPNSAIYFYEFSSNSSTEKYWTTRFAITDQSGNVTPPTETTQPDGKPIPWGTGTLISNSNSLPGPLPSDLSSPPSGSPSSLPALGSSGGSSSSVFSSSSRLSSARTPAPTPTGVNSTSSQGSSNGDMAVTISKPLAFAIGLVIASTLL